jgi:hypothetical protein
MISASKDIKTLKLGVPGELCVAVELLIAIEIREPSPWEAFLLID